MVREKRQTAVMNVAALRDARRQKARKDDILDLISRRGIMGFIKGKFDWAKRYSLEYVLSYARNNGLTASRLLKAINVLDTNERINARLAGIGQEQHAL
jgi:hypothetical protein